MLALRKNKKSSTKKTCEIIRHALAILIPGNVEFRKALKIILERTSATIMKKYGDNGLGKIKVKPKLH